MLWLSRHGIRARDDFVHRLHCVRLVSVGMSCHEIADAFGDHPRTIQRWVRQFQRSGVAGLSERPHSGRPATLMPEQIGCLVDAVSVPPTASGHRAAGWDSILLREEIRQRFDVSLSRRQCQRLLGLLRDRGQAARILSAS